MKPTVTRNPDKGDKSTSASERKRESRRPSRLTEGAIVKLASHITERDRRIALDCYEHNLLTTDQLLRLHFTNTRIAQVRLQRLYQLRVLERFRPGPRAGEGSHPYHWILDEAGALIVADWKGLDRSELRYTRDDGLRLASSRNLTHHVEANEFFTRLAVDANRAGGALSEWYGVRTLARMLAGVVVPDGYGVLTMPDRPPLHLLLELDRGTERSQILREKAKAYADILPHSSLAKHNPLVIFAVPSVRRAQTATAATANAQARITVTVWSAATTRPVLATVTTAAAENTHTFAENL
jgi:hypothetical protein